MAKKYKYTKAQIKELITRSALETNKQRARKRIIEATEELMRIEEIQREKNENSNRSS